MASFFACSMGQILSNIDSIGEWHFVWSFLFAPSSIACERAHLGRFGKAGEEESLRADGSATIKVFPNSHK